MPALVIYLAIVAFPVWWLLFRKKGTGTTVLPKSGVSATGEMSRPSYFEKRLPPKGPPIRPARIRIAIACVLAMPVTVWWVIGDASEDDGYLRIVEPPAVPSALEHGIGIAALCTLTVGLVLLVVNKEERERERRWRPVLGASLTLGVLAAFGWRVVSAATAGANIGGGLFLFWGLPTILALLLWVVGRSLNLADLTVREDVRDER